MTPGKRSTAILIRLTPGERGELEDAAEEAGLGVGPWIRSVTLATARQMVRSPKSRRQTTKQKRGAP